MAERDAYSLQHIENLGLAGIGSAIKFVHGRVTFVPIDLK